jgi:hypothetical protein
MIPTITVLMQEILDLFFVEVMVKWYHFLRIINHNAIFKEIEFKMLGEVL